MLYVLFLYLRLILDVINFRFIYITFCVCCNKYLYMYIVYDNWEILLEYIIMSWNQADTFILYMDYGMITI